MFINTPILSNNKKCKLGEDAVSKAFESFGSVLRNIRTTKEGQGDIDTICYCKDNVVIIEVKNPNENFEISLNWNMTHIVDRYINPSAYDVINQYCNGMKKKFVLVISKYKLKEKDKDEIEYWNKLLNIEVIEIGKQALNSKDQKLWIDRIVSNIKNKSESASSVKTIPRYSQYSSPISYIHTRRGSFDRESSKAVSIPLMFKVLFIKFRTEFNLCEDSLHVKSKIKRGLDKMKCKYKQVINKINIISKYRLYNSDKK